MAGDWLKMRIDLQSHPKVVRIMSAMRPHDVLSSTDKFRVIGGLHAVWSVFDTHSSDGELHGYTPEALDHIIGWHGFSNAMIAVDWLAVTINESLVMPEFSEHNGQSGKRRAEDQKRKREDRKCPQSVRNLSANEPDEKWTREEKRREDINTAPKAVKFSPIEFLIDNGADKQIAEDWLQVRKTKKLASTKTALETLLTEVEKSGLQITDVLKTCCNRGWGGFSAKWLENAPADESKPWER